MTAELQYDLTSIECLLLGEESPDYIEISWQSNFIYILMSKNEWKYWRLDDRIHSVFEVLKMYCPDFLEKYSFIVECLDSEEMDGLFDFYAR